MSGQQCRSGVCGHDESVTVLDIIEDGKFLTVRMTLTTKSVSGLPITSNVSAVFLAEHPSQFNCCTDAPNFCRSSVLRQAERQARQLSQHITQS